MSKSFYFNADTFSRDLTGSKLPVPVFKNALSLINQDQWQRFQNGVPAAELVKERAWLIDQMLVQCLQLFFTKSEPQLAFIAVGGYGRGELFPASDVDILILGNQKSIEKNRTSILEFTTFLWDCGLKPGESIRTIEECFQLAHDDITIATNLMESRLLTGSLELYQNLTQALAPEKIWPGDRFFEEKLKEQQARYHKFDETAYKLEPNIKESPGGLRDIQTIAWVAKRHFRAHTVGDLFEKGFLNQDEYHLLLESQNFLWKIRFALHFLAKRAEDRLLFDFQKSLALHFGYSDDDKHLAVEQFMKRYYRTAKEVIRLNEMLLQLFHEAILDPNQKAATKPLNRRFQVKNDFIEMNHPDTFKRYPFALLEIFLLLQQHPKIKGVRATTIRAIRDHRYLIDDNFRNDLRCRSLFMEIIRQPQGITHELRRMNRYGILAAYVPIFAHIVGQMQYDLFHVYTVDEHSLFVVRNLRRFSSPEFYHEFPFCSAIIQRISKPELLYLAGFFHDIAKGRGGDHSELGAQDAMEFCLHHGLSQYDARIVSWLVRYHLLMSVTAQKKDIEDSEVIQNFANQVENGSRLDYLYLLTIADIRATNPALWNNWKGSLLNELYQRTQQLFSQGLAAVIPLDEQRIEEIRTESRLKLIEQGISAEVIQNIWSDFGTGYFLRYSPDEITWHTLAIAKHSRKDHPLVLVRPETHRGGSEIFLYTKDHERLFAATTSLLSQMGLTIVDARINSTHNNNTLDSYIVLDDASGEPIHDAMRLVEIRDKLTRNLLNPQNISLKVDKHQPLKHRYFNFPIHIIFNNDSKKMRTIMELSCNDQPGLLSRVGQAFLDCGVLLQGAKIATYGSRAEDIFFVTDNFKKILSETQQNCLREHVQKYLAIPVASQ